MADNETSSEPSPESFVSSFWQLYISVAISIPSAPLYLIFVVVIMWKRRTENLYSMYVGTFYNFTLSQAFTDFLAMVTLIVGFLMRNTEVGEQFLETNSGIIAPIAIGFCYYLTAIRCFGDFIFSFERFLLFKYPDSYLSMLLSILTFKGVMFIQCAIPLFICLPNFVDPGSKMFLPEQVDAAEIVAYHREKVYAFILCMWVLSTFIATFVMDIYLMHTLCVEEFDNSPITMLEMRFTQIVVARLFGQVLTATYYFDELMVLFRLKSATIQEYYPLINSIQIYLNPWIYLIYNFQLRHTTLKMLNIRKTSRVMSVETVLPS